MTDVFKTGLRGERVALEFLTRKGYRFLASRFRYGRGEVDLVMKQGAVIVFVEVKYRTDGERGDGLLAVTRSKQNRIRGSAMCYAVQNGLTDAVLRFDVVEITPGGVMHVENAF